MLTQPTITRHMRSAMQGVVPSTLATCAADGTPNVTYISQVFYVDDHHVALSWQFMNKTWRNLQENPRARVVITCPGTFSMWKLKLRFREKQTEGPVFDQMDMQLMAIASMYHAGASLTIKAALICEVLDVEVLYDGYNR
ncbi:MAG: pyridoxamine 5'-phosphate oxidase family protein [Cytophagales bacterium]|nr:pyridoxamine 5'-phosphate oxidase family protein [Cytophagales bacterium]